MIWLTWRQFRVQFLVVATVIAAAAVLLAVTGPGLLDDYHRLTGNFIQSLGFERLNPLLYFVGQVLLYAVPPVIGAFWGAPMIARELETGTHRLAWSQSVSRARWLATKVGVTGLSAVAITGLLSLAVTWWADPIDDAINAGQDSNTYMPRMFPGVFGARGLVPIGYAAFAFALGVAIGLVVRRTLVALAITLAAVILVQILAPTFVRQHLLAPTESYLTVSQDNIRGFGMTGPNGTVKEIEVASGAPAAWKFYDRTVDKAGKPVSSLPDWVVDCAPPAPPAGNGKTSFEGTVSPKSAACYQRLADEGYRQHLKYFTADRFWALQWREFGFFVLLALALTGFSFWRIRRDLS
ncbi:ABC-2 family transporter [Kribbella sp. VKM Ac-2571]|uniref:ABC transporter permease n=1 Tax=Kribbella sp. VKM Ac-2571 TaxID=2512222 RepID=UPI001061BC96|nr:ABC transporter permease subunit [Kribbella sp. VKM Ac-2571]TDO68287.1 ABC-2 family transporter [Kribbella sp. VKM Ac-2571]